MTVPRHWVGAGLALILFGLIPQSIGPIDAPPVAERGKCVENCG